MRFVGCLQRRCATDELSELRVAKLDFIGKVYRHVGESRNIDAGREILQVFTDPSEMKMHESREDRACRKRQALVFPVKVRLEGSEFKTKCFEAGQHGEASDHHLRRDIPGMRNIIKAETDEVSGGQ